MRQHAHSCLETCAAGAQHLIVGTDFGRTGNPSHLDGYQLFVQQLEAAGIAKWTATSWRASRRASCWGSPEWSAA
jgi:hypothetical protein